MKRVRNYSDSEDSEDEGHAASRNIFTEIPDESTCIKRTFNEEFKPAYGAGPKYVFNIPCDREYCTDLENCFVKVDVQVFKANGQDLTADDQGKIQPCNDFFDALFSDVTVFLNNQQVGADYTYNPQTSLLHRLLNNSDNFLNDILADSIVWHKDRGYPADNSAARHWTIAKSRHLKLYGQLTHNFFTTKKLLLPNIDVQIILKPNSAENCLIRTNEMVFGSKVPDTYKIVINECKLVVRRAVFYEHIYRRVDRLLAMEIPAKYPFTMTKPFFFNIGKGFRSWRQSIPGGGTPNRLYFVICDEDSINGKNWENNPMIFPAAHYKLSRLRFYINEKPLLDKPFEMDFDKNDYAESYMSLVQTTPAFSTGKEIGIRGQDFAGNYGVFCCDNIRPDNSGELVIEVNFGEELPNSIIGVVFQQYDQCYTYSKHKGHDIENMIKPVYYRK